MEARDHPTLRRRCNLTVVDGDCHVHHANGETTDDAASNEHTNMDRSCLNDASHEGNDRSNHDGNFAPIIVGTPRGKPDAKDRAGSEGADNGTFDARVEGSEVLEETRV